MPTPFLPYQRDPIAGNLTTPNSWYEFFRSLRQFIIDSGLDVGVIDQILARLDELEENSVGTFVIQGLVSVQVLGIPKNGIVQVQLVNDVDAPGNLYYYRTDADGVKGWSFIKPDELPISLLGVYPKDEDGNYMVDENNSFMMTDLLHQMSADPDSPISNVQRAFDVMISPGIVTGGEVTQLTSTSVRITGGTALLRVADDNYSELRFFRFASQDFSVPDVQVTHFYALDYNGGSPIMVESTVSENWDRDTQIPLGSALRGDGLLNVTANPYRTGDVITNLIQRLDAIGPVQRDNSVGGLQLGETGTRNVTVSAGRLWARVSDFTITSKNSATNTMASVFFNGTNLTVTSGLTQWDNLQFNNVGTGSLVTLGNNKYANLWFFMSFDGTKYGFAYGTNEYNTLGDAANEGVPAYLTQNFFNQFILLGRFVFQKSATTAAIIESAFVTPFSSAAINTHNNLGGLQVDGGSVAGEYYHLSQAQATAVDGAVAAGGGFVNVAGTQTVTGAKTFTAATTTVRGVVDIIFGGNQIIVGADNSGNSRTDATNKTGRVTGPHYLNAEEPVGIIATFSDATRNIISWGGSSSIQNTATEHRFYTAANNTTLTGTQRWIINSSGHFTPAANDTYEIGSASLRVATTYTVNINQSGARFETGVVSPAQLTANTDNWAVTGITTAAIIRATTDASRNLTGIASPTNGQMVRLINVGAFDLVLVHDATSTAANRFLLPNSANLTLNPNDSVSLWYDNTSSRWRALGV